MDTATISQHDTSCVRSQPLMVGRFAYRLCVKNPTNLAHLSKFGNTTLLNAVLRPRVTRHGLTPTRFTRNATTNNDPSTVYALTLQKMLLKVQTIPYVFVCFIFTVLKTHWNTYLWKFYYTSIVIEIFFFWEFFFFLGVGDFSWETCTPTFVWNSIIL